MRRGVFWARTSGQVAASPVSSEARKNRRLVIDPPSNIDFSQLDHNALDYLTKGIVSIEYRN
ncbi:hypothetical protein MASR1M60_16060 [Rhodocyclaceae bacterium]